jgi:hypothetical protein
MQGNQGPAGLLGFRESGRIVLLRVARVHDSGCIVSLRDTIVTGINGVGGEWPTGWGPLRALGRGSAHKRLLR